MPNSPTVPEAERILQLERDVRELQDRLARLEPHARPTPSSERVAAAFERRRAARWSFRGEQWTGRMGLVLLFLGLVFLFRYSVEQGWITPPVRVAFATALGAAFLAAGLRIVGRRPSYGAILLAGSVATFYASGWAASYLYQLLGRPIAFGWMVGVTLLAFTLARRYGQPALASLGALGGFATPFLLRPGSETLTELALYTTLVVLWTTALYVERRWRSVLWTYLVGGLAVLSVATGEPAGSERWLLQAALLITWSAGAAYPFLHECRSCGDRNPYSTAIVPYALELRLLGAGGTAAALAITNRIWGLGDAGTGWLFIAAASLFGTFAWFGTRAPNYVARSAAPVAGALLATGAFLILGDGPARWYAVAVLGAVALYGGGTPRFGGLEWVGHGLFALLALESLLTTFLGEAPSFGALGWSHLFGVTLGALAARFVAGERVRVLYRAVAHILVLVWLADHFSDISGASEWVTVAWAAYGGILLLIALEAGRLRTTYLLRAQAFASSALALAVLKLLVIDMAQVSALVRIPLFLGTGLGLIALSALFQRSVQPRNPNGSGRKARA